ncbi:hypothetical protein AYW79_07440 [Ferroacidibacillus organovorans]|uniref:Thymidylate kinase n=1 Tax=Ferroacidibacillus organovorans TaxID=1765683 RepID=A0A168C3F0_9BACL|nr:dTMP kinase [Ferroacidibacillus organovorans]KYP81511.1 hypothetical protein AYJ22_07205 [Ferroacidibacillus organovorans]OAG94055.1 hypothetical protein AYW79_07440 [Ferroacidibacillus organovorans]OPG16868.1 dTMP kinase [Ferroacidibacillus organovorans]
MSGRGWFITFEGIDGAGKSTQVDRMCERLRESSVRVTRTREPGGTPIGDRIRGLLLDPASSMHLVTEAYLYAASRAEHVRSVIRPGLADGALVISDRFVEASMAYQAEGELTVGRIAKLNEIALDGLEPDLTILIDLPVVRARERLMRTGNAADRLERRDDLYFERVRGRLLQIAAAHPNRVFVFDGEMDPAELHEAIWRQVKTRVGIIREER